MTRLQGFIPRLQEGDWVAGTSVHDERFRGYVEAINRSEGTVQIYVVECDHEETVGRTVETFAARTKRLMPELYEEDLRGMVDLALSLQDKTWFFELSDTLNEIRLKNGNAVHAGGSNPSPMNRL